MVYIESLVEAMAPAAVAREHLSGRIARVRAATRIRTEGPARYTRNRGWTAPTFGNMIRSERDRLYQ